MPFVFYCMQNCERRFKERESGTHNSQSSNDGEFRHLMLPASFLHTKAYCTNILAWVPILSAAAPEQWRGRREQRERGRERKGERGKQVRGSFSLMHVLVFLFFLFSGFVDCVYVYE